MSGDGTGDETVRIGSAEGEPEPAEHPPAGSVVGEPPAAGVDAAGPDGAGESRPAEPGRSSAGSAGGADPAAGEEGLVGPEAGGSGPAGPEPAVASSVSPAEPADHGRSPLAALLFNLTGFGLGYAYLRRWLRTTACAVIAVLLVVVAFTNDAAREPWLWRILAALWIVGTAADAWWVARHGSRPPARRRWRPVAVGVAAVLAVVAAYLGYGVAGRATYAAGVEAQSRADCVAANRAFDAVAGPFELTLSRDVGAAELRHAECTEFLAAQGFEAAGAHADAVAGYRAYRDEHPGSPLDAFAREGTRRVLLVWAGELRSAGDLGDAIDRYRDLLGELDGDAPTPLVREDLAATYIDRADGARAAMAAAAGQDRVDALRAAMEDLLLVGRELANTSSAAGVAQAVLATFTTANDAVAAGRFCDALPVLDYAVTLPDSAGVAGVAHRDRARSLSECGLANYGAGDLTGATTRFGTLVGEYPDDPGVAQARSALIAAEVGRNVSVPLPLPAPLGAPGSAPVVVYNAAATEVRVLVSGPTAHEITLPGCPGCPPAYQGGGESCPGAAGRPSVTVQLRPGAYYVMQDRAELGPDETVDEPVTVRAAGGELCVTVTRDN
ncbi:hypothetical protein [Pseudonocardia sp. MH-G8]|uniref:hypothetical protein n=1 Tax=Pseudonocardia sp. MH-G8 TaxID=1854588 RepID=UPI000BA08F9A|nr:hypothetical protein [Pseudonocardia sp. MH-G8]OZM81878.1 hypothetical protein CFP66_13145 [Pseudonocardia sp. MH-G8]